VYSVFRIKIAFNAKYWREREDLCQGIWNTKTRSKEIFFAKEIKFKSILIALRTWLVFVQNTGWIRKGVRGIRILRMRAHGMTPLSNTIPRLYRSTELSGYTKIKVNNSESWHTPPLYIEIRPRIPHSYRALLVKLSRSHIGRQMSQGEEDVQSDWDSNPEPSEYRSATEWAIQPLTHYPP
jgi:hypothetical protein